MEVAQSDPSVKVPKLFDGEKHVQEAGCGGQIVSRRLSNGKLDVRICYDRDFLRSCADSPYSVLPPANIIQMVFEMSEILSKFPRRYHAPTSFYSIPEPPRSNVK